MLYDDAHYDTETVRAWANGYWEHNWPRGIPVEQRADLQRHQEALFTEEPLAYRPHEMDQGLVERARAVFNRPLPAEPVFSRLQQTGVGDKFPDFIVSRAAGPYADQVLERKSGRTLATGIDALYTYDAHHQEFRPRVLKLIATLENERWVLGTEVSLADKMALLGDVRGLYLREYIRQWQALLLDDLALAGGRDLRETAAILGLLSDKRDSPLLLLFRSGAPGGKTGRTGRPYRSGRGLCTTPGGPDRTVVGRCRKDRVGWEPPLQRTPRTYGECRLLGDSRAGRHRRGQGLGAGIYLGSAPPPCASIRTITQTGWARDPSCSKFSSSKRAKRPMQ